MSVYFSSADEDTASLVGILTFQLLSVSFSEAQQVGGRWGFGAFSLEAAAMLWA